MAETAKDAYHEGVADLGKRRASGILRFFPGGARSGGRTSGRFAYLPAAIMSARSRALAQPLDAAVDYEDLSEAEKPAIEFLYRVITGGERFLYIISDSNDTNSGIFELAYVYQKDAKERRLDRDKLPSLATSLAEDINNGVAAGGDIVTFFVRAAPESPVKQV